MMSQRERGLEARACLCTERRERNAERRRVAARQVRRQHRPQKQQQARKALGCEKEAQKRARWFANLCLHVGGQVIKVVFLVANEAHAIDCRAKVVLAMLTEIVE